MVGIGPAAQIRANRRGGDFDTFRIALVQGLDTGGLEDGGDGLGTEFAETLYWNAGVRTGAKGVHEVSFDLSDSITTFRALVDAVAGCPGRSSNQSGVAGDRARKTERHWIFDACGH